MDIARMRACAPFLPEPGNEVVLQCLDEIERLRAQCGALAENCVKHGSNITALEIEIERLRAANESLTGSVEEWRLDFESLSAELAAAHAREAKLREALRRCRFDSLNMSIGDLEFIRAVFAAKADDTALRERLAAERERIAAWLEQQRNYIPATGEEFAEALRALGDPQ